jgi:hypothetical protein
MPPRRRSPIAPPPPTPSGLTEAEKRELKIFIAFSWNGEDSSSRVSERVRNLDTDLFPGATLLDEYARSNNQRFLVYGFRLYLKETFAVIASQLIKCQLCRPEIRQKWVDYTIRVDGGRAKSTESFWCSNFYQDRLEEHLRLKTSLQHPSHHYTFGALKNSWYGERSRMGPFGNFYEGDLLYCVVEESASVFGISMAQ